MVCFGLSDIVVSLVFGLVKGVELGRVSLVEDLYCTSEADKPSEKRPVVC